MAEPPKSNSTHGDEQPGKIRTEWHPLLVRLLRVALGPAFNVYAEVLLGNMPFRVDILLIRAADGQLSEVGRQELSVLVPLLNRFTLIEFKGPTDAMMRGDFAHLVGCSYMWHSQEREMVPCKDVSLIVILPAVNGPLRDELHALGCEVIRKEPGVFNVAGPLPFATWLVETDEMAEQGQPVLSLVSRVFLNDRWSIIEKFAKGPYAPLVQYMLQQVKQFHDEEDLTMQQALSENLERFSKELLAKMLEELPPEERLHGLPAEERLRGLLPEERVRGLLPEERVHGLPAEDRLRGLSLEQRLAGISKEEAARLRKLLEQSEEQ